MICPGVVSMNCSRTCCVPIFLVLFLSANEWLFGQTKIFDYSRYLFGAPSTISLSIQSIHAAAGTVTVNGGDSQAPTTPFTWIWGDGQVTSGFFPQSHSYSNATGNYVLKVIANYSGGKTDSSTIVVRFVPPSIIPITLSPDIAVTVPTSPVTLGTRLYTPPSLTAFNESFFTTVPRPTLEYVLSVISSIEKDFVNDNVFLLNSKFEQVMLRDSSFGGAYSLWYTNPVAFGVGDVFFQGSIGYSAFFHEMGHNYTLNSPGAYYYGGRIDGNANAIYSESMANMFQHAAGYEIVNNYQRYGLSEDLMWDIQSSLISSINVVRASFDNYLNNGKKFVSWNDPNTTVDETSTTFMTIAYKFCEQAENTGQAYKAPLKRMMKLLQGFNPSWSQRYDQSHNTAAADTFRASLMVTAMSYGFGKDLRSDFRNLNFPISDEIYNQLYNSVTSINDEPRGTPIVSPLMQNYPNPFNPGTTISYSLPKTANVSLKVFNLLGQEVAVLVNEQRSPGYYQVQWNATVPSGIYFYRLQAGDFVETRKMLLIK